MAADKLIKKSAPVAAEKEKKATKKPEKVETVESADDDMVNVVALVQEAYEEANPEDKVSKKLINNILKAYHDVLPRAVFMNGSVRVGNFGKFFCQAIQGRKGVSKMSGEEKEWETKDHWSIKFRTFPSTNALIDELEEETGYKASDEFKK